MVVFDSRAPVGSEQGVYASAVVQELMGTDLERGLAIFSRRSEAHGAGGWTLEDVRPPARHRLYRATVSEHSVLGEQDRRKRVGLVCGDGRRAGCSRPTRRGGRGCRMRT